MFHCVFDCVAKVSLLQLRAAGEKLLVPASDVLNHAANQVNRDFPPGRYEWDALVKFWERSAGAQSHWPAGEHTIRHGTVPDGRAHDRANRSGGRGRGRVWAGSKGDEGSVNQSFDERRGTSTAGSVVKRRRRDFLPGDWECPGCEAHNFSSRSVCFRCHQPKPHGAEEF